MRSQKVNRTFAVDGTTDRVVLFSWSADPARLKRNVARLDRNGNVLWRAELPPQSTQDCFNRLERCEDGFIARTFSEWAVWLDDDGTTLQMRREPIVA